MCVSLFPRLNRLINMLQIAQSHDRTEFIHFALPPMEIITRLLPVFQNFSNYVIFRIS